MLPPGVPGPPPDDRGTAGCYTTDARETDRDARRLSIPTNAPLIVLLAAPPDGPGARVLLARAVSHALARPVAILLTKAGLQWRDDPRLEVAAEAEGLRVGVCSADAREAGWTLETTPDFIEWSALVSWVRGVDADHRVWVAL